MEAEGLGMPNLKYRKEGKKTGIKLILYTRRTLFVTVFLGYFSQKDKNVQYGPVGLRRIGRLGPAAEAAGVNRKCGL